MRTVNKLRVYLEVFEHRNAIHRHKLSTHVIGDAEIVVQGKEAFNSGRVESVRLGPRARQSEPKQSINSKRTKSN